MVLTVKCPECQTFTKAELMPVSHSIEVNMDDLEPPYNQSEDVECSKCGKQMHVTMTVELFED